MNHDNEGRHWVHPLGVFSPCEDSCLIAIECKVDTYVVD
jgi:hypothetical protein